VRILVLSNFYPPHHFGGYELSCRDVMTRLALRGHDITVLASDVRVDGVDDPCGERDVGIRRDLHMYWDDHVLLSPSILQRWRIERANQRSLRQALAESAPDVVSVWNMGAMSLGLLKTVADLRVPMVFAVCDDWLVYGPRLDAWQRLFLHRPRLARLISLLGGVPTALSDLGDAGAFCFVSDFTRERAEQELAAAFSNATVVYSGIERADFPRRRAVQPSWGWRLLYVGRIDERKGLETLLSALADLPSAATLEIIGRGDPEYVRKLQAIVQDRGLGDRVRFDVVDRAALAERYSRADVCVFPSEWDEPFGLVPVEAMACGTPVVATGTGGSGEFLVDEVNCLRYTPGDAVELAAAVMRLAGDEALRARLVVGGEQTSAELDTDRLADVFEAWHLAAVDEFRRRPPDRPRLDGGRSEDG
jgi:glycogen(starch) synthase